MLVCMTFSYHASTKLDEVTTINCTFQPAKQTRSNSFNYRVIQKWNSLPNNIDFASLKRFNNLWPMKCYFHFARYIYLVGCAAYRQYMFCILYSCVFWTIFLHVFMHVSVVADRSFSSINWLIVCMNLMYNGTILLGALTVVGTSVWLLQ